MEMLEMTRLSRSSIITGKLFSAVSFVALLLISSLPLTSICFFLGGVSPEEVALRYALLLAISFVAATLGIVWSTIARTTAAAVVFTYASLLAPLALAILVGMVTGSSAGAGNPYNPQVLAVIIAGLFGIYIQESFAWSPGAGIIRAWDMRHFYGLTLPSWFVPVLSLGLVGLTMAAVATSRLETFPDRSARKLRLLVLAIFVEQILFLFGARFAVYSGGAAPGLAAGAAAFPPIYMLSYPVLLLMLCIPVFATGEVRRWEAKKFVSYLFSGCKPSELRRGHPASGAAYLLILAATIIGMYVLSFAFVGNPSAAFKGPAALSRGGASVQVPQLNNNSNPQVTVAPGAPPPKPAMTTVSAGPSPDLWHAAIAIGATVLGLSALGMLFSVATRNRWASMALLYTVILGIMVAPSISQANFVNGTAGRVPSIFVNLYYLNPLMSLAQMSDTSGTFWNDMNLMFWRTPFWLVTTLTYLFIAFLSYVLMLPFVTKIAAGPVLPYEDLAAKG